MFAKNSRNMAVYEQYNTARSRVWQFWYEYRILWNVQNICTTIRALVTTCKFIAQRENTQIFFAQLWFKRETYWVGGKLTFFLKKKEEENKEPKFKLIRTIAIKTPLYNAHIFWLAFFSGALRKNKFGWTTKSWPGKKRGSKYGALKRN